jgi:hypothetical protein
LELDFMNMDWVSVNRELVPFCNAAPLS